jgi:glycosyltransferase involved in cell wall biosynthesis
MYRFYERAAALVCTSSVEGFPNTFVEAWSRGLPVISTFDPDGVIARGGLGLVARDSAGLGESLERILNSPELWHTMVRNARMHYLSEHTPQVIIPRFQKLFDDLMVPRSRVGVVSAGIAGR